MIRNCLAKTTRGRWFRILCGAALAGVLIAAAAGEPARPKPKPARRARPANLAVLVRALRQSPSPARRAAVAAYAVAHAKDNSGLLARLALGVAAYEQKDYPAAIEQLKKVQGKLPAIADYTAYYLAASLVESNQPEDAPRVLAPAHSGEVKSPLAARAWILEARALAAQPAEAVRVLREHYAELSQPEGDLALADSYQAANDLPHAAEFYQRVYYEYVNGAAASRAAAALTTLKDTMGTAYPPPLPTQMLRRAGRLMEAGDYDRAFTEYQSLPGQLVGLEREQARVRIGEADLLRGNLSSATQYLRSLEVTEPEADAERLYYLEDCARRAGDDAGIQSAVEQLGQRYSKSLWRLKALASAAGRFLLVNQPEAYVPLYRTAYEDFPDSAAAGLYHWKVAFHAYMHGDRDAEDLLREHLVRYPGHATAAASLYFLSRHAERRGEYGAARAWYRRLTAAFPNTYYGMLARERLRTPEVASAGSAPEAEQFAAGIRFPQPAPLPAAPDRTTTVRIGRSRLLRAAGLSDLADAELRFGARNGGQRVLLGMEMAVNSDAPHDAMRIMKSTAPDYLRLSLDRAPRKLWELLFPLPYRADLERYARAQRIDPFLLAGLIRQESEFDPRALSRANAYGLTQVRPGTGRQFARKAGIRRFTNNSLFQPAINLNIGASVLRSMLDQHGGKVEETLAAYNAGPNRAADWIAWNTYREPAEFVESIPFTETRDYVQAVLRNADLYRRLYR
jgi:peptidoglycan lytic transglycosylase